MTSQARTRITAIIALIGVLLSACGGSHEAKSHDGKKVPAGRKSGLVAPCTVHGRAVIAAALGVQPDRVKAVRGIGNNSYPQCTYTTGHSQVVVNVYTGPQTYFLVERQAVEASQQTGFSGSANAVTVTQVNGIGLEAFWFPATAEFLTTDGASMITVNVVRPRTPRAQLERLGETAARAYLRAPRKRG